jgi:hypothetical protein
MKLRRGSLTEDFMHPQHTLIQQANHQIREFARLHERSTAAAKRAADSQRIARWSHSRAANALINAHRARRRAIAAGLNEAALLPLDRPELAEL